MAEATKSYDARDVVAYWGELRLDGAAPGSFVNLTYRTEAVEVVHGAQGFAVATVKADDSGEMTWTASQAAPINALLSAYANLQRQQGVGVVKKPLTLKHINGDTIAVGPEAMIAMEPGSQFGAEHEVREWKWVIPHLKMLVGGSSR